MGDQQIALCSNSADIYLLHLDPCLALPRTAQLQLHMQSSGWVLENYNYKHYKRVYYENKSRKGYMMGIRNVFCTQAGSNIGKLVLMPLLGSQHLLHEMLLGISVLFQEREMQQRQFENFWEGSQGKRSLVLSKAREWIASIFFRCFKSLLTLEHVHDAWQ